MSRITVAVSGLSVVGTLAPGMPVLQTLRGDAQGHRDRMRIVGLSYDPLDPPSYDPDLLDASYLLPYPAQGAAALLARLRYIHAREHIDVILPTLDSELPHYIQLKPELSRLGIHVLLPSAAAFARRTKAELESVSALSSVKVPRSLAASSLAEALSRSRKLKLPFVVKGNLHGATVVHTQEAIAPAVADHAARWGYPVVLQEYIPGTEFDVVALADEAWQLVGVVPMKKLQLDDRGKAWGALTVDDPGLIRAAQRVAGGLCWSGPLELELMRHRDSGELYLIEINPRFPAWVYLASLAGQNLPMAQIRMALGEPVVPFGSYRSGVLQLRRSVDVGCSLSVYEAMVQRGEVDLGVAGPLHRGFDPALQPQQVWLGPILDAADSDGGRAARRETPPGDDVVAALRDPLLTARVQAAEGDAGPPAAAPGQSRAYEAPAILRHHGAVGNRLPRDGAQHRFIDQIDGVAVADLTARYGSPLFVFSEARLRTRARAFRQAFAARYPRTRFGWSYKTNYIDALCGILHQEGWDAEVVSDLEYAMARRLGIPGSRIVCNGASKPRAWLELAVREGAFIQVDHFDELNLLEEVAAARPAGSPPVAMGLRVNMQVPALGGASWERFGFNLDSGEVLDAILRLSVSRHLRLSGLHCHLGTFIQQPAAYREATARLCELFLAAEALCRHPLSLLNLGGGFPSSNQLAAGQPEGDDDTVDITPFATAICDELMAQFGARGDAANLPTLMLESGRHLIDDAGSLIATVVGTRRHGAGGVAMPGSSAGSRALVLDAGLNVLYTAHWYRHRVTPAQPVAGLIEETALFGPLCMNIDALRVGLPLPPLVPGHRVVIQPVGAYNVTQWMQFSQLRPAIVLVAADGTVEVIRRGETLSDVKDAERLPDRYRPSPGMLD